MRGILSRAIKVKKEVVALILALVISLATISFNIYFSYVLMMIVASAAIIGLIWKDSVNNATNNILNSFANAFSFDNEVKK